MLCTQGCQRVAATLLSMGERPGKQRGKKPADFFLGRLSLGDTTTHCGGLYSSVHRNITYYTHHFICSVSRCQMALQQFPKKAEDLLAAWLPDCEPWVARHSK